MQAFRLCVFLVVVQLVVGTEPTPEQYGGQDATRLCSLVKNESYCPPTTGLAGGAYPNWMETATLAMINWARLDPTDFKEITGLFNETISFACNASIAPVEPLHPLMWSSGLNQAARFQSYAMTQTGCAFASTTCNKFTNLFNNSASPLTRIKFYDNRPKSEGLAAAIIEPQELVASFLRTTVRCNDLFSKISTRLGLGYVKGGGLGSYWTADFGAEVNQTLHTNTIVYPNTVPSGSHVIRKDDQKLIFFVSHYGDTAANGAKVIVQGEEKDLSSKSGKASSTFSVVWDRPVTACMNYYFRVYLADGTTIRHPRATDYQTYGAGDCTEPLIHPVAASTSAAEKVRGIGGQHEITTQNVIGGSVGLAIWIIVLSVILYFGGSQLASLGDKLANPNLRKINGGINGLLFVLMIAAAAVPWSSVTSKEAPSLSAGPWVMCTEDECEGLLALCPAQGCPAEGVVIAVRVFVVLVILQNVLAMLGNFGIGSNFFADDKKKKIYAAMPFVVMLVAWNFLFISICLWVAYVSDVIVSDDYSMGTAPGAIIAVVALLLSVASSFMGYASYRTDQGGAATNSQKL